MRCFIYLPPSISEQANSSHIEAVLLKGKSCQIPRNAHINAHIMLDWKQVHFAAASHIHQFTLKVTNLLLQEGGWNYWFQSSKLGQKPHCTMKRNVIGLVTDYLQLLPQ